MPELRKDPIVDRWVIIAKNRAQRPQELDSALHTRAPGPCPFCEGNERATTPEVLAFREPGSAIDAAGWRVRVVPNKFPALTTEGGSEHRGEGLYQSLPGFGAHEVIIESPRHLVSTSELTHDGLCEVIAAYRDRLLALKADRRLVHAMVFKNAGAAAGASIEHVHSQLIALPVTPTAVQEELDAALAFHQQRRCCIFCDLVERERASGERMVLDLPGFVAICPFASRFPFETWIVPTAHQSHFESITHAAICELALALREAIRRIETALNRPAYNYVIHTAPFDTSDLGHYHWHIEVAPRLTKIAGFEWGAGYYINPAPPEEAAAFLRSAEVDFTTPQNVPIKEAR
jgi:UDPglucose--hexose-1-phosphate uridylyltransferase